MTEIKSDWTCISKEEATPRQHSHEVHQLPIEGGHLMRVVRYYTTGENKRTEQAMLVVFVPHLRRET